MLLVTTSLALPQCSPTFAQAQRQLNWGGGMGGGAGGGKSHLNLPLADQPATHPKQALLGSSHCRSPLSSPMLLYSPETLPLPSPPHPYVTWVSSFIEKISVRNYYLSIIYGFLLLAKRLHHLCHHPSRRLYHRETSGRWHTRWQICALR